MIPGRINFFYFGFLFCAIVAIHAFHVLLIEISPLQQTLFLGEVLFQCVWEVSLVLVLGELVLRWIPKAFYFFVGLTFLLLLAHLVDFFLVRFMDLTIWHAFSLVREESLENFIEMLRATNIPLAVWSLIAATLLILPFVGIALYLFFRGWRTEVHFPLKKQLLVVGSASLLLLFWDICRGFPDDFHAYDNLRKTLPLKATLSSPRLHAVDIGVGSLCCGNGPEIAASPLPKVCFKPDIYLFIAESLREDFLTDDVAPTLSRFKRENIASPISLSSANATHLSWFSLFHSQFPMAWGNPTNGGAFSLKLLKELGYSIHVYSSARLSFYGMEEKIFGANHHLADQFELIAEGESLPVYAKDEKTVARLIEEMRVNRSGGHLHIIFLDSTHFDYSWPKESATFFLPVQEEIDYFKAIYSKEELEAIKNRYRNSIHYLDSLFARFLEALNETERGKESLVVFTGDHGEEFYEEGHLFHASSLNAPQTQVPIYYKLGEKKHLPQGQLAALTSHVDIFPTLLHYIFQQELSCSPMQGESIFKEKRWPFVITARYNAGKTPTEFFVHNGRKKITLRMDEERGALWLLSLKDLYDQKLPLQISNVQEEFGPALERLFAR